MPLRYEPEIEFDEQNLNYVMRGPSSERVAQDLILAFHRDIEGKIRKALIELGWTPPNEPPFPKAESR